MRLANKGERPTLWRSLVAGDAHPILHQARIQEAADDAEKAFVTDSARDSGHENIVLNPVEGHRHTLPTISTFQIA